MANEFTWGRPKCQDDEEELLRQQNEFFKAKQPPSARIINKLREDIVSTSQGSGEMINPVVQEKIQETSRGKVEDMVQNVPQALSSIVLGNIVERKFDIKNYKFNSNRVPIPGEMGFPKVFVSDMKTDGSQSLFWQKISALRSVKDNSSKILKDIHKYPDINDKEETSVPTEDALAAEIHQENLEKLARMSEEEILQQKRSLEETLDPKVLQFLKNKKNKRAREMIKQKKVQLNDNKQESFVSGTIMDTEISHNKRMKLSSNENDDVEMDCKDDMSDIPQSPKQLLEQSKDGGWLHMDTPEPEKLKWMEDLSTGKEEEPDPTEPYNARFDFNGLLLPYKDENLSVNKGLHHHGEEPERPGYSLQELLQLSRSSNQQQRCTALTTLANIMEKTRKGWYDKALHPAPLSALSEKNILLLLRFSLDDTSVAVVTAALQALRAFLYSEADEVCLDRLQGFDDSYTEPSLMPHLEDKDTNSLKDHELAQLDSVATLLRTDFLLRLRYILNEMHPPPVGVVCALEILIRVARHSHITALNISSVPYLLDTIIHNFMPVSIDRLAMQNALSNAYGIPIVQAVKLCRVLVTYGKKPVAQKLDDFKIIQAILTYISSETGRKDDINLSIESLRLWRILLHYEIGSDSVVGAQLTLISQLQLLLSNHDIHNTSELACEYAAALIVVASCEKTLRPNISILLTKWSTQLSSISNVTWGVTKLIAVTLSTVNEISAFKTTWLSNQYIFSMLRSNSNLLSDSNPAIDREPSCLPNLDVLVENGELQPLVSLNSCIPFLATVLNAFHDHSRVTEIRAILGQPSFYKYIRDLEMAEWNFEKSWYSRTELYLLIAMIKAASLLGDTIDSAMAQIIWKITIKLVSALPADAASHVKKLLQIALSNEKINLEVVTNELAKLNLTTNVDHVTISWCTDAASLYEKYISSNGDWYQAAMPKDWVFLPLVHMYTKCKSDVKLKSQDKNSVMTVLSMALILPDLIEKLSSSLRFSRLILVYLCDTMYLDRDISTLLTSVMSNLLRKYHAKLDFRAELPGLSSFTDLFTALCEQFCSSSYGDDGFAAILLVFIAQRHDTHYRKLLWSEHAGALRYLRLPPDKLAIPLKEYLYPEEEDTSLIENYITTLVRGSITEIWCPVLYAIAVHHSAMYLKRSNKLAIRMRTQVEKLRDKNIVSKLLQYQAPQL